MRRHRVESSTLQEKRRRLQSSPSQVLPTAVRRNATAGMRLGTMAELQAASRGARAGGARTAAGDNPHGENPHANGAATPGSPERTFPINRHPDNSDRLFFSPGTRRMISAAEFAHAGGTNRISVGELYKMATVHNPVCSGSVTKRRLICLVSDFREGRIHPVQPFNERSRSFIFLSDVTGSISIRVETVASGLSELRVPDAQRNEESLCFFDAEIEGSIGWVRRHQKPSEPVFFLNSGSITRVTRSAEVHAELCSGPSSASLGILCRDPFWSSSKFTTTTVIGRVYDMHAKDGQLTLSLMDPMGCMGIVVNDIPDVQDYQQNFGRGMAVKVTGQVRLVGKVQSGGHDEHANAEDNVPAPLLNVKFSATSVLMLDSRRFDKYVENMLAIPNVNYMGPRNPELI